MSATWENIEAVGVDILPDVHAECSNCRFWVSLKDDRRPGNIGLCNLIGLEKPLEADFSLIQPTTDMSVCSRWESQ